MDHTPGTTPPAMAHTGPSVSLTPPPLDEEQVVAPPGKRPRGNTSENGDAEVNVSLGCVVLIEVTSTTPDFIKPWKMHSQRACKGSGFVIDGQRILTNFHVVQDAIDVRLRKHVAPLARKGGRLWP